MTTATDHLSAAWIAHCEGAGFRSINLAHHGECRAYFARLDARISADAANLRGLIARARDKATGYDRHYVEGIDGALQRAIAEPRTA